MIKDRQRVCIGIIMRYPPVRRRLDIESYHRPLPLWAMVFAILGLMACINGLLLGVHHS